MHICVRLSGPGRQRQEPIFWLEILLETRMLYKSLEGLINFLAFLVQMLWPKKSKIIREIPLGIIYKISNEDILRLPSPQWELSDDVLHMPLACVLAELLPFKIYVTHEWFWWLPFSLPQNWGKRMDFTKFFFTTEERILGTTFCQVFATIKWLQWEWFGFKISWLFSC